MFLWDSGAVKCHHNRESSPRDREALAMLQKKCTESTPEHILDQCKLFKDTAFAQLFPLGQKVALVASGMTESKNA